MNFGLSLDRSARLCGAVTRHHANASLRLSQGADAWACIYESTLPDGGRFDDVATKLAHSVSVWMPDAEAALAEGGQVILTTARWPQGQVCRIVTAVEIDATGWASFDISPLS